MVGTSPHCSWHHLAVQKRLGEENTTGRTAKTNDQIGVRSELYERWVDFFTQRAFKVKFSTQFDDLMAVPPWEAIEEMTGSQDMQ